MSAHSKNSDAYLVQRILGASPEQQAALIMEAGQLHLGRALQAMKQEDLSGASVWFLRVTEVIAEATLRLDLENGGELAHNLQTLYEFWSREIMEATDARDPSRIEGVIRGMGEIREAWEQLHVKKTGNVQPATGSRLGDQLA